MTTKRGTGQAPAAAVGPARTGPAAFAAFATVATLPSAPAGRPGVV